MMSTISKCARLSRIYTNVRIRATTYSPADGTTGCASACMDPASTDNAAVELKVKREKPEMPKKQVEIAPKPPQVRVGLCFFF